VDRDGALWAATWDGLNKFDASTGRFTRYKLNPDQKDLLYLELTQDPSGGLWLGTHSSGVHRFDPNTGKFTVYEHQLSQPGTLSDNRVNSVHFDPSGTMWVGTQNGLNQFDNRTGKFNVFTEQEGLAGNVVGCILDDGGDELWMSTNNGVSSFNVHNHTFKNYSTADGLPGPDLTGWGACFKSPAGEMFFGGFSGGVAFYPAKIVGNLTMPPIVLTDFRLFGKPPGIGGHSPLTKAISYSQGVTLRHSQSIFSLEFSALSYSHPSTTRYRYRLEPTDGQWNEVASDQRVVTYNTLPPGEYVFRAQASNNPGPWSEPGVAFNIHVLPPWWASWWFRTIYSALIAVLAWGAYRYRLRQVASQFNLRLEERVAERTRIARELHDTLLQGFISASMQLHVVDSRIPADSSAKPLLHRVLALTEQVVQEGRNTLRGLRSKSHDYLYLEDALALVEQEFAPNGAGSQLTGFRVVVEGKPMRMSPFIQDEIYRIAREAIVNAFRHAKARNIETQIKYEPNRILVAVKDDGCGIDSGTLHSGREGHWGLTGMRERADSIGANLQVFSNANAGTEIELSVPGHIAFKLAPTRGSADL
jgi:signal transduction histidine kinase